MIDSLEKKTESLMPRALSGLECVSSAVNWMDGWMDEQMKERMDSAQAPCIFSSNISLAEVGGGALVDQT